VTALAGCGLGGLGKGGGVVSGSEDVGERDKVLLKKEGTKYDFFPNVIHVTAN
jgi:hypothetical protein